MLMAGRKVRVVSSEVLRRLAMVYSLCWFLSFFIGAVLFVCTDLPRECRQPRQDRLIPPLLDAALQLQVKLVY
jgi:hypothetical protein